MPVPPPSTIRAATSHARRRILDTCLFAQRFFQPAGGPLRVVWRETDAGMAMYVDGVYHTTLTWEELDVSEPSW